MNVYRKLMLAALVGFTAGCADSSTSDWQLDSVERYEQIENGMSYRQVVELLGEPDRQSRITEGNESFNTGRWLGRRAMIHVYFDGTTVVGKDRTQ